MFKKLNVYLLSLLVLSSCGIINIRKSGGNIDRYNNYTEDLQESRVQFAELPEPESFSTESSSASAIDSDLNRRINQIAQENNKELFANGFTILIYSGVDREKAFEIRNEAYSEFPKTQTYMEYEQPRYLVKVGRFINKIEALATYEKMNVVFPTSRIIRGRFLKFTEESKEGENIDNVER
ncbi:hypothetical protein [uncultured Cyclobacterium sp.]|uniref:hypothetical protein n=1 Tax=uncultured Cyclobacterium sp. TaxID=453820 RepID=UPI0030EE8515|tara:strand:- start:34884 stop:35426 length:543 start_codon:yes stop_codon:yes gene_type:complete